MLPAGYWGLSQRQDHTGDDERFDQYVEYRASTCRHSSDDRAMAEARDRRLLGQ